MRAIYRQSVPADDQWHTFELRGPILHVATRYENVVEIWHLHDTDQPATRHEFTVQGTGHQLVPDANYVGTAVTPSGRFVWHLMERKRLDDDIAIGGTD